MSHPAVDGKMHMGIGHTLALRWVYIGCMVGIHWVYVGFTFGARWVYIGCTLGIHWVYVGHMMGRSRVWGSCSRNYGQGRLSSKRPARLFLIFNFTIFIISVFIVYTKITIAVITTSKGSSKDECSTGLKQSFLGHDLLDLFRSMIIKKNRSKVRDNHRIVIG